MSKRPKKQQSNTKSKCFWTVLYYVFPCAVMIGILAYSVTGILRFQHAMALRLPVEKRDDIDDAGLPFPARTLNPNGKWSFAGIEWNCSQTMVPDQDFRADNLDLPQDIDIPNGLPTETEQRLLQTVQFQQFIRTDHGNTRLYSLNSDGFVFQIMTGLASLPVTNNNQPESKTAVCERFLFGRLAMRSGLGYWETVSLTLPENPSKLSKHQTLIPLPNWAVPLCSRLDENELHVFEIYGCTKGAAFADMSGLRLELNRYWTASGWRGVSTKAPVTELPAQWTNGNKLVSVQISGNRPADAKIMLIDGTIAVPSH
jgi:hypothetical protein